jgi:release factor glutamine methyltransferase
MMTSERKVQAWMQHLIQQRSNSETPKLDAQLLLSFVSGKTRAWLIAHADEELSIPENDILKKFAAGMPMAYLLGQQEFWSLPLTVTSDTLIPRPDTECLVEWILEALPKQPQHLLDMGTGSGAIALALKSERPDWQVTATDQSSAALAVAAINAESCQLEIELVEGSWWEAVPGRRFDCVVSNPPYIAQGDSHLVGLQYEPISALAAGRSGLDDLSVIAQGVYDHLNEGGWLVVEHGYDQQAEVKDLFTKAGLIAVKGYQDLSGQDRFVAGFKGKA